MMLIGTLVILRYSYALWGYNQKIFRTLHSGLPGLGLQAQRFAFRV